MKKSVLISALAALALMAPASVYSQFIINDKDGWTNIRKEPNAKSAIVGRVVKHEVFHQTPDCGSGNSQIVNWVPVDVFFPDGNEGSYVGGYIFKNNITDVRSFPKIESGGHDNRENSVITAKKDSITVTMKVGGRHRETGGNDPRFSVKEIVVTNGKQKTVVQPKMGVSPSFTLYIGNDGALYLTIQGEDEGGYLSMWYSIVNGKVVHHVRIYSGC